jgi:hypothetical protein
MLNLRTLFSVRKPRRPVPARARRVTTRSTDSRLPESLEPRWALAGGPYLHIHDSSQLGVVDVNSGEVYKIGNLRSGNQTIAIADIGFNQQGQLYGVSADRLYRINPGTAILTDLGAHGIGNANGMVFGPSGQLYVMGRNTPNVYLISDVTRPAASTSILLPNLTSTQGCNGDLSFIGNDLVVAATNQALMRYRFDVSPTRPRLITQTDLARSDVMGLANVNGTTLYGLSYNTVLTFNLTGGTPIRSEVALQTAVTFGQLRGSAYYAEANGPVPIGTFSGTKWRDDNADGVRQGNEPYLEDWSIYVDRNLNGAFDAGEPRSLTDSQGRYLLFGNAPGLHTVDEVIPRLGNWEQTYPRAANRQLVADYDFDNGTAKNRLTHAYGLPDLTTSGVSFRSGDAVLGGGGGFLELPANLGQSPFTILIDGTYSPQQAIEQFLVSQRLTDTPTGQDFGLSHSAGSPLPRATFCNAAGTCAAATGGAFDGQRHQYAITWDGANVGLFFDTDLTTKSAGTTGLPDITGQVVRFGNPSTRAPATGAGMAGSVHGIRIYNTALNQAQLRTAFAQPVAPTAYSVYLPSNQSLSQLHFGNRVAGTVIVPEIEVHSGSAGGPLLVSGSSILDLGTVNPQDTPPTSVLYVKNVGTSPLTISGVESSGPFSVTGTVQSTLQPNQSISFTVRLTDMGIGSKTGQLQILNNDSDENPFLIGLAAKVDPAAATGSPLYVLGASGTILEMDPKTGATTERAKGLPTFTDIAQHPKLADIYAIDGSQVYQIDLASAKATPLFAHGITNPTALGFSPSGALYAAGTQVYQLDLALGTKSLVVSLGTQQAGDLAYLGNVMYVTSEAGQLIRVSPPTPTILGNLNNLSLKGLAAVNDTTLYGFADNQAYLIDVTKVTASTSHVLSMGAIIGATTKASTVVSLHNAALPQDVDGDGRVVPLDSLLVINELNQHTYSDASTGRITGVPQPPSKYPDVNNDGFISPVDAILIINYLNDPPTARAAVPVDAEPTPPLARELALAALAHEGLFAAAWSDLAEDDEETT